MLIELQSISHHVHLCAPQYKRAMDVRSLEYLAQQAFGSQHTSYTSVAKAVEGAMQLGPVLVCGSFYIAEEALAFLHEPNN